VVVPPDGVKTDETTTDEASETVVVPPFEVMTVAVVAVSADGVETNDEAETGTETVEPDGVVTTSVTYGAEVPGVVTVKVDPETVVMVSVTGVGRWTVAVAPDGVTTVTVDSDNGT